MATLLHSESRRLYSWWWDSHISPKNSKWLQENLTDMDSKVKAMIKLIEEDADSFARRAEMYYKKRPELIKLVEDTYRAYRALAERYDHATGELRQAHRTMAAAFPNQVPFVLAEDAPSGNDIEPHTPEMPHPIRALLNSDEMHKGALWLSSSDLHDAKQKGPFEGGSHTEFGKKGLKQLHEIFGSEVLQNSKFSEGELKKVLNPEMDEKEQSLHVEVSQLSNENQNLKVKIHSESESASKAESKVEGLKKGLADIHAEKAALFLQCQQCLEKLSNLEGELSLAQEDCVRLNEQANEATTEVHVLKGVLVELENVRDSGLIKQKEYLKRISDLEGKVFQAQENASGLNERATKAETEAEHLKHKLSGLSSEKDANYIKYKECLKKIAHLENQISVAEEYSRLLNDRAGKAETEVNKLEKAITELTEEKEAASIQYDHCFQRISKLERELSCAQEDVKCLNSEVLAGAAKLKSAEEKCGHLEISNHSLRLEADNLATEIAIKDQELSKKQEELEKLQTCLQDEHLRYVQVETTLKALQDMHSQSQEEQRALALEFRNGLQMLKSFEMHKLGLEEELQRVKDENQNLNELNLSSSLTAKNLENEILSLRVMKERLEEELSVQIGQSNVLQKEICDLKEEIKGLNRRYQDLIEQLELAGLNPEFICSSVKELRDENSRLRQTNQNDRDEKEALSKKLEDVGKILEKNAVLEISLSDVNGQLQGSQEKVRELQESIQLLCGEKSALVAEKAALLSQLQAITDNMQMLLEKNAVLENSLSGAKIELEGLREKSKGLEALCQLLNDQKSNLLSERSSLSLHLENVQERLLSLKKRFTGLEEKYAGLEKEKDFTLSQVQELKVSLDMEKQERANCALLSETRLAGLENQVCILEEASWRRKREFEEELDKAVNAQFEIFILQKFIQDMEEKNYSLLIECQKQVEASKLTEQLISELENENLEQQVEGELLLDEIERLRLGIYHVFKALEIGQDHGHKEKIENEQIIVHNVLESIEHMKCSLSEYEDDNEQLSVENSILLTLLGQLKLEGKELELAKKNLDQEFNTMAEQQGMIQDKKQEILETNRQLRSEVTSVNQQADILKAELDRICKKQGDLLKAYLELQENYAQVLEENGSLVKKISELKDEKSAVMEENDINVQKILALDNLFMFFRSFGTETAAELKSVSEALLSLHGVKDELEKELSILVENSKIKETDNLLLKDSIKKLEMELNRVTGINDYLTQEISSRNNLLSQWEAELMAMEQKVKDAENLNSELCNNLEGLKREFEKSNVIRENLEKRMLEMSEQNAFQNEEIACLCEENGNLKREQVVLSEEVEERRIREESLSLELQDKDNEFELWEAEASSFYFDLQISSICEVLFENKVGELAEVCKALEDESVSKTVAIEEMKERVRIMEGEIGGLRAHLSAYSPVVASLREDVESLAQKTLYLNNLHVTQDGQKEILEVESHPPRERCEGPWADKKSLTANGISDLQKLQARIKAVEQLVSEEMNRIKMQASLDRKTKLEDTMREIQELKSRCSLGLEKDKETKGLGIEFRDNVKIQKAKPKISEVRNGTRMKDIPLDQVSDGSCCGTRSRNRRRSGGTDDLMLKLWETAEHCNFDQTVNKSENQAHKSLDDDAVHRQSEDTERSEDLYIELQVEKELGVDRLEVPTSVTETNHEGYNRNILERLASDAQRLASLYLSVQDLRSRLETKKKKKRPKEVDIETVKEQLQEVEETVTQLVDLNGQLKNNIKDSPSCSDENGSEELGKALSVHKKRISEQTRKVSERIGQLQLEVQKIQYILLKLEDDKGNKGRNRFSKGRTTIVLRDFIYNGHRSGKRPKKTPLCGCFMPSQPFSPRYGNNM